MRPIHVSPMLPLLFKFHTASTQPPLLQRRPFPRKYFLLSLLLLPLARLSFQSTSILSASIHHLYDDCASSCSLPVQSFARTDTDNQRARTNMWICSFSGSKLPDALARECAFGVASLPGEGTCAGREDGRFASGEGRRRDKENDLEAGREGHCGDRIKRSKEILA